MTDLSLPSIDMSLCTACGICVEICPAHALEMSPDGPRFSTPENCTWCSDCEALCPSSAITCDFEIGWGSGAEQKRS